jgi:hypothetical protein
VNYASSALVCRAGIDPRSVRDDDERMPCVVIRGITGTISCERLELAPAAPSSEVGEMAKALAAIMSRRCPKCEQVIEAEMEFNDSILAMPCRHVIRSEKKEQQR